MYEIIKRVITSGQYDLTDMLSKIDTIWIQGNLNDEQHDELIELAREKANVERSVDVYKMCVQLEEKQRDLEQRVQALESTESEEPAQPDEPTVDIIAEWQEGKRYYNDDLVKFKGQIYRVVNVPEGQCCVWSPEAYPHYWELVE